MTKKVKESIEKKRADLEKVQKELKQNLDIRATADSNVQLLRAQFDRLSGAIAALEELETKDEVEN